MKKASIGDIDYIILQCLVEAEMRDGEEDVLHDAIRIYLDSKKHREMLTKAWHAKREAEPQKQ